MSGCRSKSELSDQEKLALNLRMKAPGESWMALLHKVAGPDGWVPPTNRGHSIVPFRGKQHNAECSWGYEEGLCLTSLYEDGAPEELVLRRFWRAYGCAVSIGALAKDLPNFPFLPMPETVEVRAVKSNGSPLECLYCPLYCTQLPVRCEDKYKTLEDLIGSPDAQNWKVISAYLQVVLAVRLANATIRFAHNALSPKEVLLAPYAKLFSINYGEVSLVCGGAVAVITGYSHSQYAYVYGGSVVEVPPDLEEGRGINLHADASSDIYAFTKECHHITTIHSMRISRSSDLYAVYAERTHFFRSILEYFVNPLPSNAVSWPKNVSPPAGPFMAHLKYSLETAGLNLISVTSPCRGNMHLRPLNAHESTWYTMDLRSLVAYSLPPQAVPVAGPDYPETTHLSYLCSEHADGAVNRILENPSESSVRDLEDALEEFPFTLALDARRRAWVLGSKGARELYARRVREILDRPLAAAGGCVLRIGDVLRD